MRDFTTDERDACQRLIELALEEDLGAKGDITSQAVVPIGLTGRAVFVARQSGVVAGLPAAELVVRMVDPDLIFEQLLSDGTRLAGGERLATVSGSYRGILAAERTALNFLQHLSGVASMTRCYVDAVAGLPCRVLDTRKTLPGWRRLQKYAVRCGGGHNHRMGLFDAILIKDNHLVSLFNQHLPAITQSVQAARQQGELHSDFVEIEVDTLIQLDEALRLKPDIVLLDNMTPDQLREAVRQRSAVAPAVQLEASGGITLESIRAVAETGVDRISVGALTHSVPALDIGLDFESA